VERRLGERSSVDPWARTSGAGEPPLAQPFVISDSTVQFAQRRAGFGQACRAPDTWAVRVNVTWAFPIRFTKSSREVPTTTTVSKRRELDATRDVWPVRRSEFERPVGTSTTTERALAGRYARTPPGDSSVCARRCQSRKRRSALREGHQDRGLHRLKDRTPDRGFARSGRTSGRSVIVWDKTTATRAIRRATINRRAVYDSGLYFELCHSGLITAGSVSLTTTRELLRRGLATTRRIPAGQSSPRGRLSLAAETMSLVRARKSNALSVFNERQLGAPVRDRVRSRTACVGGVIKSCTRRRPRPGGHGLGAASRRSVCTWSRRVSRVIMAGTTRLLHMYTRSGRRSAAARRQSHLSTRRRACRRSGYSNRDWACHPTGDRFVSM